MAGDPLLRITFVLPFASIAGGVRVVAIYARKLIERGHEVTVVSRRQAPPPDLRRRLVRRLRNPRARFRGKAPTPQLDFLGDRHIEIDAYHPIDPGLLPDADAIVATWWESAFFVAALPPSKGRKFYFVQHHEVHDHLPAHLSAGSYYLPLKKIAISQWLVDTMAESYGDTDVALVENSVDMEMFHAPPRGRQARPTVGLLYATNPFKGVDISLKAIEIARAQVPDLHVVAFGAKPVTRALPLPEGSDFHLRPAQEEIRDIYAACDVWLFGSRSEGFGLPILEAMACRTPVIATPTGAAPGFIADGHNGYLVAMEDAPAMAARIVEVAQMPPETWRAMSDAAQARIRQYSWDDATDRFEAALRKA
jgi:glycosyltransferase involved in cell wall biosynthesis